jgi:hypothetical protein
MDTNESDGPGHLMILRAMPKADVIRMTVSAGRLLEHPSAIPDGLEAELRAFIEQLDIMAW